MPLPRAGSTVRAVLAFADKLLAAESCKLNTSAAPPSRNVGTTAHAPPLNQYILATYCMTRMLEQRPRFPITKPSTSLGSLIPADRPMLFYSQSHVPPKRCAFSAERLRLSRSPEDLLWLVPLWRVRQGLGRLYLRHDYTILGGTVAI